MLTLMIFFMGNDFLGFEASAQCVGQIRVVICVVHVILFFMMKNKLKQNHEHHQVKKEVWIESKSEKVFSDMYGSMCYVGITASKC